MADLWFRLPDRPDRQRHRDGNDPRTPCGLRGREL